MTIETTKLEWNGKTKTFSADASDLPGVAGRRLVTIRNPKTHGQVEFEYASDDHDAEGEVTRWRWTNRTRGLTLLVYND